MVFIRKRIVLIRHIDFNSEGVITERGIDQLETLIKVLELLKEKDELCDVFSSTSANCVQTALSLARAWQRTNINDERIFTINSLSSGDKIELEEAFHSVLRINESSSNLIICTHFEGMENIPGVIMRIWKGLENTVNERVSLNRGSIIVADLQDKRIFDGTELINRP